jgi:hypothetical protein
MKIGSLSLPALPHINLKPMNKFKPRDYIDLYEAGRPLFGGWVVKAFYDGTYLVWIPGVKYGLTRPEDKAEGKAFLAFKNHTDVPEADQWFAYVSGKTLTLQKAYNPKLLTPEQQDTIKALLDTFKPKEDGDI